MGDYNICPTSYRINMRRSLCICENMGIMKDRLDVINLRYECNSSCVHKLRFTLFNYS